MEVEFSRDGTCYTKTAGLHLVPKNAKYLKFYGGIPIFHAPEFAELEVIFSPSVKVVFVDTNEFGCVCDLERSIHKKVPTYVFNCRGDKFNNWFKTQNTINVVLMVQVHNDIIKDINKSSVTTVFVSRNVPQDQISKIINKNIVVFDGVFEKRNNQFGILAALTGTNSINEGCVMMAQTIGFPILNDSRMLPTITQTIATDQKMAKLITTSTFNVDSESKLKPKTTDENKALTDQLIAMRMEIAATTEQLRLKQAENASLSLQLTAKDDQLKKITIENSVFSEQLDTANMNIKTINEQLISSKQEIIRLELLTKGTADLNAKLNEAEAKIKGKDIIISTMDQKIVDFRGKIATCDSESKRIRDLLAEAQQQIVTLKQDKLNMQTGYETTMKNRDAQQLVLQQNNEELQQRHEELRLLIIHGDK